MQDWLAENEALVWWLFAASVLMFVGTLLAVPVILARLPADYFAPENRQPHVVRHPALRLTLAVLRNAVGAVLVVAGILMLVLPGQGLLTIVIGLLLMDFPGKYQLERRLVRQPQVLRGINWIRSRAGKPPMRAPPPS